MHGCRASYLMLGDKEITVRIRSNSHYRILICSANQSSRNACRSVTHKSLLGSLGEITAMRGRAQFLLFRYPPRRVLLFCPFAKAAKCRFDILAYRSFSYLNHAKRRGRFCAISYGIKKWATPAGICSHQFL